MSNPSFGWDAILYNLYLEYDMQAPTEQEFREHLIEAAKRHNTTVRKIGNRANYTSAKWFSEHPPTAELRGVHVTLKNAQATLAVIAEMDAEVEAE
jgi:hypothetical protein